ncbi:hypothetical protein BO70DRAFT_388390 [Aspergillus heteromorphus CBS 117.55]|uniref:Methyltransferase type 11 domain-containing protein n=1 Tax=Aspergillus heteromorphus CBS 117.55 TaxID=1448321 RepID=A0A317VRR5_9EURO|nr:uncharacterized protein BO70DRAFT_388390 [Aspergillus heteromorphus CBS 117.55]PWY77003.1 hypothetical protein BO70DRAFT_388390 [Aspergillus heteromorphus CBS 117.55]
MSDPTFRNYTSTQAQKYAEARTSYPKELYDIVLRHHEQTGGTFHTLLDVGCGPGNATRDLARSFQRVVGIDAGQEMIQTARGLGGNTAAEASISYHVLGAEECDSVPGLEGGGAHWFSMPELWSSAAKTVKPGGTVALWTRSSFYCHPSTPHAPLVQKALFDLELNALAPHTLPQNRLSRDMYDDLPLPWTVSPAVPEFPESEFVRREWDRDGVLTDGKDFFGGGSEMTIEELERGFATASMVTRWREANPGLVGTEGDCVAVAVRGVRGAILEAQGEGEGWEWDGRLRTGMGTVVLLFKRR